MSPTLLAQLRRASRASFLLDQRVRRMNPYARHDGAVWPRDFYRPADRRGKLYRTMA